MHALSRSENIKIYREFGFEVPLSSKEALVGMMDRLEIDFAEKTIRVVDYKFTANPKSPEELIKTYEIQLKLYLWAATKLVGFIPTKLEAELIHFTENKLFERIPLNFSAGDLLQIDDLVKTLYNQARKRVGPPRLGDYCRYCEFVARCPAQAKT
jgi:predicted RecB family nuclease